MSQALPEPPLDRPSVSARTVDRCAVFLPCSSPWLSPWGSGCEPTRVSFCLCSASAVNTTEHMKSGHASIGVFFLSILYRHPLMISQRTLVSLQCPRAIGWVGPTKGEKETPKLPEFCSIVLSSVLTFHVLSFGYHMPNWVGTGSTHRTP